MPTMDWRHRSSSCQPQQIRQVLAAVGFSTAFGNVKQLLVDAGLDSYRAVKLRHFLLFIVLLGAESSERSQRFLHLNATYGEALNLGVQLEELWDLGYGDLAAIRQAGWSPQSV